MLVLTRFSRPVGYSFGHSRCDDWFGVFTDTDLSDQTPATGSLPYGKPNHPREVESPALIAIRDDDETIPLHLISLPNT